ncbi:MAG: Rrf2 family transcriptional regulator [Gammaproteobacteria bacterium]
MRLSTKGRYAVTAMMELAIRDEGYPVSLAEISQTQGISNSYLEQLFRKLSQNNLVYGTRGPRGGYRLSRPADEINIAEIIIAVDEKIDSRNCEGRSDCQNGQACLTHELWEELSLRLHDYLSTITLGEYINRPKVEAQKPV